MTSHPMPNTPPAKSGKILRTLLLCATALSWLSAPATAQKSINRIAQLTVSDFRVALSFSPTVPIQGQPVSFTGSTTGDVRFWLWDFGDGWTSTRQNEVHTYRKAGFYRVSLTATGPTGAKKTLRTFAVMPETLAASFVFSPTSPRVGQTISFADTTSGNPTAWAWDFGDGATSTAKNPAHAYSKTGSYAVTLSATTSSGTKKASRSLTVATMSILSSSFSFAPAAPTAGQSIQFTDTSAGNPTAWLWVFGDGLTSTAHNPIHVFSTPGSYNVTLTTTNGSGSKTTSRTVVVAAGLVASFSFAPATPSVGQSVQFTDTSTGSPTAWSWNFGDGATSTSRNPSHAFSSAGSFNVSLTATGGSGTRTSTRTVVVGAAPTASFTFSPSYPDVGQTVQFSDLSTGSPTSWQWNFNDGATSAEPNPTHAFAAAGSYAVVLVVNGASGSHSTSRNILVGSGDGSKSIYWVSPNGTATWAGSRSESPLAGAACSSIATANANAAAGDTVYFRGGTYSYALQPSNSGLKGSPIVFSAYGTEEVVFTVPDDDHGRWGFVLSRKSWIKIVGIKFLNCACFYHIGPDSHFNEIASCTFDTGRFDYSVGYTGGTKAPTQADGSTHNWFHHCTFTKYGKLDLANSGSETYVNDNGTIRFSAGYNDNTAHNTIENCVFSYGGHDCLDVGGRWNVVKNNIFHNEEAFYRNVYGSVLSRNDPVSGYFGNRCIHISNAGDAVGTAFHNLIEGNRIGFAGTPPDDDGSCGIENAGAHTVVRFNDIYGNGGMGYYSKMQGVHESSVRSGSWGRVYNNNIFANGFGDPSIDTQFKHGICIWSYTTYSDWPENVVIKNNIVYGNYNEWRVGSSNILPQVTYENNFSLNPGFLNVDLTDKTSPVLPDLRLSAGSPCVDAGIPLTQAIGAGSDSTALVVDDALLFQDGSWGSALTHGVTHFPDWIAVGTVENIVRIAAIDYATKTITLASPLTWANGAKIWLYSDSGGRRVLKGAAPDIGAHEIDR